MTLRTFSGNSFGGWSFGGYTGAGIPSRALTSSVRQQGAVHLMPHTCDIERAALSNVYGRVVRDWQTETEDVRCMIQEKNGGIVRGPDGQMLSYKATAFVPIDTDIRPQGAQDRPDRLVWTNVEPAVVFNVLLAVDESGMGDHLTVYLDRLPDPAGPEV